jgi:hypothetical protein
LGEEDIRNCSFLAATTAGCECKLKDKRGASKIVEKKRSAEIHVGIGRFVSKNMEV